METFFLKLLMWLELGLYKLVDKVLTLFNVFAGLSEVNVTDDPENTYTLFLITISYVARAIISSFEATINIARNKNSNIWRAGLSKGRILAKNCPKANEQQESSKKQR